MTTVFIGAGSNVDPEDNLARALAELERRFGKLQVSAPYRNPAVGIPGPDFINLAISFETDLDCEALRAELRRIETVCGRDRSVPKATPPPIDLDLLICGDYRHPELAHRDYLFKPLEALRR